ncbi:MAG TPA: PIG-L family deacetylase [Candidatus Acidoferrum sp.]|nr:PIG-L family deacetylase [Candidatus Acidoferrum sp.]
MKPTPTPRNDLAPLLAFGAHPDDVEFACGGIIAKETLLGRRAHIIVCSRGEAGSNGTPSQRVAEAETAAALLSATVEFVELDGDAHLEIRAVHAIKLAGIVRRVKPGPVLAPSLVENQHPDHWRLGKLVRDAARLARYGGVAEIRDLASHTIEQLLFYAVTPEAEPRDSTPILIDVSAPEILGAWTAAMEAHVSQSATRNYAEMQLTRARLNGHRAGGGHAIPLFSNDPMIVNSLGSLSPGARRF